jgi:hypothetical protein
MDDRSSLKVKNNWYSKEYILSYIALEECQNTTTKVCESEENIE